MQTAKYDLKVFVEEAPEVDLGVFIPVFHRWIQTQALDDLLIDVADYRHVHHGPGVILIGHRAHYAMDLAHGRLGLCYRHKRYPPSVPDPDVRQHLTAAFRSALTVCERLEAEPELQGTLRFRGETIELRLNDRLQAPNTIESFAALQPSLEALSERLYPDQTVTLEWLPEAGTCLTVRLGASGAASVRSLLTRLHPVNVGAGERS